ncbi:MAG: TIGR03826 family flagellar region protein [Bacillota bacterium]
MNLKNCPRCGKLFAKKGNEKLCPVCRKEEESDFEKVKEYLWDHPKASIDEVHEATGVERDTIIKFIKEDRLIAEGIEIDFDLECERCGKPIESGRYCESCQQELITGLNKEESDEKKEKKDPETKESGKMYTVDRVKRRKRRE